MRHIAADLQIKFPRKKVTSLPETAGNGGLNRNRKLGRERSGVIQDSYAEDEYLVSLGDGTPKTNRTSDLPLRRGLLYPLSYRGCEKCSRDFTSV